MESAAAFGLTVMDWLPGSSGEGRLGYCNFGYTHWRIGLLFLIWNQFMIPLQSAIKAWFLQRTLWTP